MRLWQEKNAPYVQWSHVHIWSRSIHSNVYALIFILSEMEKGSRSCEHMSSSTHTRCFSLLFCSTHASFWSFLLVYHIYFPDVSLSYRKRDVICVEEMGKSAAGDTVHCSIYHIAVRLKTFVIWISGRHIPEFPFHTCSAQPNHQLDIYISV